MFDQEGVKCVFFTVTEWGSECQGQNFSSVRILTHYTVSESWQIHSLSCFKMATMKLSVRAKNC